ncbi:hypothetical protein [Sinisalibacter lacisalsi]|uniref:Uncharacterized protein n=1 Tax=Sinisalibacter lacisalsi TaxID=1526570 RepID=A0ABQ1QNJ0_9RHOB|nr:hypothetical protein [Sinisalibacter lacisalsi]GGD37983.1 hypothetical protein GCM10011358_22190 [Sinisalibacter lacisalsi]
MINRHGHAGLVLFAAALYGGPVLAGMAGHGAQALPVFAALFLLYMAASRKPDLATGAGWAGLAIMAVVQAGIVVASWGLGLGAAQLLGPVALPLWAPLAITGLAAGVGTWALRDAAEMNVMLDHAIREIEALKATPAPGTPPPWPEASAAARAAYDRFRAALAQGDGVSVSQIDPLVQRLEIEAGIEAFDLLFDDVCTDTADPRLDFAALRFIASPALLRALVERGEGGVLPAFLLNAAAPSTRHEARGRVLDMIEAGAPADQLPDPAWLDELDAAFPGEGYGSLLADRLAPETP